MPRVVDHDARRAQIVAAVLDLVAREGVEAVTVRKAAAAAGVSTGALAHYFADKEQLLAAAYTEVVTRVGRRMEALAASTRDPVQLLVQALLTTLPLDDAARTEARIWLAFLDRAQVRPEAAQVQREVYRQWRDALAWVIARAGQEGYLRADLDPHRTASFLIAVADGLALQATLDPEALDPDTLRHLVRAHVETLLPARAGAHKPPEPKDRAGRRPPR